MKLNSLLRTAAILIVSYLSLLLYGCNGKPDSYYDTETKKLAEQVRHGAGREVLEPLDSLVAADPDNWFLKMRGYTIKKDYYYRREIFDTNNLYIDSILFALEHSRLKDKFPAEYADALNNMGNRFFEVNNLKKAFEYYYKARVAAALTGDRCLLGDQSYHLGMVCYRQEKYREAIYHFNDAINENAQCPAPNMVFYRKEELINNIALAYTHVQRYDSALQYYAYLLRYIDSGSRQFADHKQMKKFAEVAIAVAYGNMSDIMIVEKRYDTARLLLLKSIATNAQPEYDNRDALYSQAKLAELYHTTGNQAMVLQTLNDMRRPMDSIKDGNINLRWTRLMYAYRKNNGDLHGAVADIDHYLQLRDTADSRNKELKQVDYVQLLQDQEKEYQLDILRKDNQVNRLYLLASIAFIVVVLAIVIIIFYSYRKSRLNVSALTTLNNKVNDQNRQLAITMEDLRHSNRDKDRILHVVAHDLRSPVGAITMMVTLIKESEDVEERNELLQLIDTSCQSQMSLINELLEFSGKATTDGGELVETFDINALASQSALLLGFRALEKNQQIAINIPPEPLPVTAKKEKITRVLGNLLTNAIKFSPRKAVISLTVTSTNKHVLIAVKDSGVGIPPKNQEHIFEPFTPAKRPGTAGEKSFGLGLSICKQIVEDSGGRIWFESEEGKGSTFYVELPIGK